MGHAGEQVMRLGSVNYEVLGRVAILTLDEPDKLNALTIGIRAGILDGLQRADDDEAVRAIILTGSGGKAFCAGADISNFDFEPEKHARSLLARWKSCRLRNGRASR